MTHENFKDMATCSFCESMAVDYVTVHFSMTGTTVYCRTCWKEFGFPVAVKP